MKYVSNVLFWISNGLLVPVIVGLLYFFVNSILLLGIFFNQYLTHSKQTKLHQHGVGGQPALRDRAGLLVGDPHHPSQ